jgi:molecular chaperone DnaJ
MDLYDLLGVRKIASASDIRRAYQKRARSLHPDLNPGDPAAAEGFRAISQAFEVLSDPQPRAASRDSTSRPTYASSGSAFARSSTPARALPRASRPSAARTSSRPRG